MNKPYKDDNANDDPEHSAIENSGEYNRSTQGAPEPPISWRPPASNDKSAFDSSTEFQSPQLEQQPQTPRSNNTAFKENPPEFERLRKLVSISQICAIISLFIGGVVLSTASLVVGFMAYRALSSAMRNNTLEPNYLRPLRRSCIVALVMGTVALAFNVISLVYVYPLVMQALDTGDFSSLMGGGAQSGSSLGSGSTTWG